MIAVTKASAARRYAFSAKNRYAYLIILALFCAFGGGSTIHAQAASPSTPVLDADTTVQNRATAPASVEIPDAPTPPNQLPPSGPFAAHALSPRQKFAYATKDAFGPSSAIFAAVGAGVNQAQGLYPEFHQGAEGYGRYYWHSYADQAVDSYFVNFVLADIMHIDPRYRPLRSGSIWNRTKHVAASLLLAYTDSGKQTFNTPQVLGSGIAASTSMLYYPERERTVSIVAQRWMSNLAGDGLLRILNEFTPELTKTGKRICSNISVGAIFCKEEDSTIH